MTPVDYAASSVVRLACEGVARGGLLPCRPRAASASDSNDPMFMLAFQPSPSSTGSPHSGTSPSCPVYHLSQPSPLHLAQVQEWLASFGYMIRTVPFKQWRAELVQLDANKEEKD